MSLQETVAAAGPQEQQAADQELAAQAADPGLGRRQRLRRTRSLLSWAAAQALAKTTVAVAAAMMIRYDISCSNPPEQFRPFRGMRRSLFSFRP